MATLHHPHLFKLDHPKDSLEASICFRRFSKNSMKNQSPLVVLCKKAKNEEAWKEKKLGLVDYDQGKHQVSVHVSGLRKNDLQKQYRLRVKGDRFQKDWSISEVVQRILKLNRWDDIEGLLNHWVGRFNRKNFPVLIRVIKRSGLSLHKLQTTCVCDWEIVGSKMFCHQR